MKTSSSTTKSRHAAVLQQRSLWIVRSKRTLQPEERLWRASRILKDWEVARGTSEGSFDESQTCRSCRRAARLVINAQAARVLGPRRAADATRACRRGDRMKRREFISTPALRGDRRADRDTRDGAGQRGVRARAKADMGPSDRLTGAMAARQWPTQPDTLARSSFIARRRALITASREERTRCLLHHELRTYAR